MRIAFHTPWCRLVPTPLPPPPPITVVIITDPPHSYLPEKPRALVVVVVPSNEILFSVFIDSASARTLQTYNREQDSDIMFFQPRLCTSYDRYYLPSTTDDSYSCMSLCLGQCMTIVANRYWFSGYMNSV